MRSTIASSTSSIPIPFLAETYKISSSLQPIRSIICFLTASTVVSALGKSILFSIGIISKLCYIDK